MMASLLVTRLRIPRLRAETIRRPRLVERLPAGRGRKLTLLSAPPGPGKTTLLSEWVTHRGRPAAWVSLDKDDNDPVRFWSYVIACARNEQKQQEIRGAVIGARHVARALVSLVVLMDAPFVAAGRLWWAAWALVALTLAASAVSRVIQARKNPDLPVEGACSAEAEDVAPCDRVLVPIVGLVGPLVTWVVAGLDVRFGWPPPVSLPFVAAGFLLVSAGSALATWAIAENRFFSAVVRMQKERGHSVISSGPYRYVRHPGTRAASSPMSACRLPSARCGRSFRV